MATLVTWHGLPERVAANEGEAGQSDRKVVKLKRVWTISGDGEPGTGSGFDPDNYNIAYAHALQDLLDNLEQEGHINRESTEAQNQWVPNNWVLKDVHTTEENEQPPGPLVISAAHPFIHDPIDGSDEGGTGVPIDGSVDATSSVLTMRWVWGPP